MKVVKEICKAGKVIDVAVRVSSGNHRNPRAKRMCVTKETVQKNAKKSQNVQATVKTVTNNESTTAVLPQTGVLSDNIFYILGGMICALGAISLAVAKRRAIR